MRASAYGILLLAACGGGSSGGGAAPAPAAAPDPAAAYAPLDVGADRATYAKVNKASFESPTHGHRFVDIYVNPIGLEAYRSDAPMPVGSIVVKTSREAKDGAPTDVAGPIFVMEKRAAGFDPEHDDWWYGLHWAEVPDGWRPKMGGATQVYWRSPSPKVGYCAGCHDAYDRELGMPPADQRAW
jgi:hypothetical protein